MDGFECAKIRFRQERGFIPDDAEDVAAWFWQASQRQAQELGPCGIHPRACSIGHESYRLSQSGDTIGSWICQCGAVLGDAPIDEIDAVFREHAQANCSACEHKNQAVAQAVAETVERCAQIVSVGIDGPSPAGEMLRALHPDPNFLELERLRARLDEARWCATDRGDAL